MPRQELNFVRFSSIATIDVRICACNSESAAVLIRDIHRKLVLKVIPLRLSSLHRSGMLQRYTVVISYVKYLCIITVLNMAYHIYAALNNLI
jgi:predicted DNA-binding transcriptional regulator